MKISRTAKYQLLRILKIEDSPHKIAGGFASGMVTHFWPFFGFGPVLAILFSKITRTSSLASLVGWGMSSWSWPFLFVLNVRVGDRLLGLHTPAPHRYMPRMAQLHPSAWLRASRSFVLGMAVNTVVTLAVVTMAGGLLLARYRLPLLQRVRNWQVKR